MIQRSKISHNPVNMYLFKGRNRNTRKRCEVGSHLFSSVLSWLFLLCLKNTTKASSMKTPKRDGFVNSEKYKVEYIPLNRRPRLSSGFSTVWPIQPTRSWIISNRKKKSCPWFLLSWLFYCTLTLKDRFISESCIEIKIELNFYFRTSLWCLKRFYVGL